MNKVDRAALEVQMEPQNIYSRFRHALEKVSVALLR